MIEALPIFAFGVIFGTVLGWLVAVVCVFAGIRYLSWKRRRENIRNFEFAVEAHRRDNQIWADCHRRMREAERQVREDKR